jgi:hypothetical protein
MPSSMLTKPHGDPAAGERSEQKRSQSSQRRGRGQSRGPGQGKPEKHDVAGHVRDEHMAERDVAHGVDNAGDHGQ